MIEVKGLAKSFAKVQAVKDVSFLARDGEITALLGDNGAGKTTTIRMIAGVLTPDHGEVFLEAQRFLPHDLAARRHLGVLSDAKGLYERLTARENMYYYGTLMRTPMAELRRNVEDAIRILDMSDIIDRRTAGFSTGQRMKVLLGRLLSFKPRNLVLDEPTSGLDVRATRRLRAILIRLKEEGHCVLFSSHIMQEVEYLGDSVIIMHEGLSLKQGSVSGICTEAGESSMEEAFVRMIEGGSHAR